VAPVTKTLDISAHLPGVVGTGKKRRRSRPALSSLLKKCLLAQLVAVAIGFHPRRLVQAFLFFNRLLGVVVVFLLVLIQEKCHVLTHRYRSAPEVVAG